MNLNRMPMLTEIASVAVPKMLDYAVFEDTLWIVSGDEPQIASYSFDGSQQAEPVPW